MSNLTGTWDGWTEDRFKIRKTKSDHRKGPWVW